MEMCEKEMLSKYGNMPDKVAKHLKQIVDESAQKDDAFRAVYFTQYERVDPVLKSAIKKRLLSKEDAHEEAMVEMPASVDCLNLENVPDTPPPKESDGAQEKPSESIARNESTEKTYDIFCTKELKSKNAEDAQLDDNAAPTLIKMQKKGSARKIKIATSEELESLKELINEFPNMQEVATVVVGSAAISMHNNTPVTLPRLLINGPPGCGKTEFFRAVARALNMPPIEIQLGVTSGRFELLGAHPTWRSAQPGLLTQRFIDNDYANPIIIFDEACAVSEEVSPGLLQFVEDRSFRDNCIDMYINHSLASVVFISNHREVLLSNLLSRLTVFDVKQPSNQEARDIIPRIFSTTVSEMSAEYLAPSGMPPGALEALSELPLREARNCIRSAVYKAAARAGGGGLVAKDFCVQTTARPKIGFV